MRVPRLRMLNAASRRLSGLRRISRARGKENRSFPSGHLLLYITLLIMQEPLFDPVRDLEFRRCSSPRIEIPGCKRQRESWKRMFLEVMRR